MKPIFPALLLLVGCEDTAQAVYLHFDGPVAAAVLPAYAGPWEVPAGFVANSRDGSIVPVDLKMGRLLTDDPTASFLRGAMLATGGNRMLSDVAVVPGDGTVTVWAIDTRYEQLLRVPYVTAVVDGFPEEVTPTVTEAEFLDVDGSGDSPTLTDLKVRAGFTTTEDWNIEFDGERWWPKGTRSGTMHRPLEPGVPWFSDDGEIEFTVTGTATVGDRFHFRTDTGVEEWDLGGLPLGLLAQDGRVYASVDAGRIAVFDGVSGERIGAVELGAGAQPIRMAAAPDGRVFVTDGQASQIWVLRFDLELDPSAVAVETIPIAAPSIDVAWQGGVDRYGESFENLFVAPTGLLRVDVIDLVSGAALDPNPYTQSLEGTFLGAPIAGLAASAGDTKLPFESAWGGVASVPTVVVSTADGFVYSLEASTGCAVLDNSGPIASPSDSTTSFILLDDQGDSSQASLWIDGYTGAQVSLSTCGGVVRAEAWTVIYDSANSSWEVEGSISGVQQARAYDGSRYLSDNGGLSFVISTGPLPPTQGDRFAFEVDDGLLVFRGSDEEEDGTVLPWESPGRPVGYEVTGGPSGGGWDAVNRKQYALLPVTNGDIAARLHLDSGKTEVLWQ